MYLPKCGFCKSILLSGVLCHVSLGAIELDVDDVGL